MNFDLLIPLLITAFVAILGWIVAHRLTVKRDVANKRRELRVTYLIDAYRQLERASNRFEYNSEDLESAIADVQLFGTPEQVKMANDFAVKFAENKVASLDELLFNLRETLRKELQLESVETQIKYLRINK